MKMAKIGIKIVIAFVIIGVIAGTLLGFSAQLKNITKITTNRTLSEVSEHYNKAFLDRIDVHVKIINMVADYFKDISVPLPPNATALLQNAANNSGFVKVAYSNAEGISYLNDSTSVDISNRDYFKRTMQGETVISEPLDGGAGLERNIVISVPVQNSDNIVGIVYGVYPLSIASSRLLDSSYYSDGYGFILSQNGDIVLSSDSKNKLSDEENLLTFFEKTDFVDFSLEELKAAVKNGEQGNFTFTYNGKRRFASFVPSKVNDWYTFSFASDAMMIKQETDMNWIVFELVLKLILIGVMLGTLIVITNHIKNKKLMLANFKHQSLLANINGGVLVSQHARKTHEIIIVYANDWFTDMTGYTAGDIKDIYNGEYTSIVHPDDTEEAFSKYVEQVNASDRYKIQYRIIKKDGTVLWVMDTGYVLTNEDGQRVNQSILTDITIIKEQEEALRLVDERFNIAIKASNAAVIEVDLKTRQYIHFENTKAIFKSTPQELLEYSKAFADMSFEEYKSTIKSSFVHPDDFEAVETVCNEVFSGHPCNFEVRVKQEDSSYIWCKIDIGVILSKAGEPMRAVAYITDISDVKKNAEFLESQAQIDAMTGLHNKVATATLINGVLERDNDSLHALIILDIDNFKGVNDTLGHVFGDAVLMDVCAKFKALFRNDDIVGRIGGDEFAVFMKDVQNTGCVLKKAAEISGAFHQTYTGGNGNYKVSCSMGIIVTDNKNDCYETLLPKADAALYQAKKKGKDMFVLYDEKDAGEYPIQVTKENEVDLRDIKTHWNIEEHIFELMYLSKDFSGSINIALAMIGQQYHVSRAYVFENDEDNKHTSNTYEWCNNGIKAEIDNLQNLDMSQGQESILDCYDKDGLFYCNDVSTLSSYQREILEPQGVLSTLQVSIVHDDKICGFIGFDECTKCRVWTSYEIETLSSLSKILSMFLIKRKTEIALVERLKNRIKILDILPDYICVINPQTHTIEYANNKMLELLPKAHSGALCYATLRGGQETPCEKCIIERIKRGNTDDLEIVSEDKSVNLKVKALYVDWAEHKKMVLLYGSQLTQNDNEKE